MIENRKVSHLQCISIWKKKEEKEGNMIQVQFMGSVRGKKPVNACPESATSNSVFVSV